MWYKETIKGCDFMEKTNVMRILDQKKIKYNEYFYGDTNAISGVEAA